jgi:alkylated DNA repair dioxygenase AlkB
MPAEHDAPLPLEQRRPDHQVGDAGLVFERDELTPFGDPGLCRTRTRPAASDSGSRLNRGRHGCGKVGLPEQFSLFADRLSGPEGPRYAEEFVSPSAEKTLIGHIAALPLQPFQFGQYEGKRRVASFGFRYDYALRQLEETDPIPGWLGPIIEKVEAFGGPGTRIGQVLCTEYDIGVIGWHRDKPHFDRVFGLSRGSGCKFRFRRPAYTKWERFRLEARPHSIYMMSGPSREVWEHSIPAIEAQRYSIAFRTMAAKS